MFRRWRERQAAKDEREGYLHACKLLLERGYSTGAVIDEGTGRSEHFNFGLREALRGFHFLKVEAEQEGFQKAHKANEDAVLQEDCGDYQAHYTSQLCAATRNFLLRMRAAAEAEGSHLRPSVSLDFEPMYVMGDAPAKANRFIPRIDVVVERRPGSKKKEE